MSTGWKRGTAAMTVVLAGLSCSGCRAAGADPAARQGNPSGVVGELRRYCIEQHGGVAMDAVDVYGGRLALHCARWAYGEAQSWLR